METATPANCPDAGFRPHGGCSFLRFPGPAGSVLLLLVFLGCPFPGFGFCSPGKTGDLTDKEALILYGEFRQIQSFGLIAVSLVGDAVGIGLDQKELTDYLRTKFRTYLPGVRLEDVAENTDRFLRLVADRDRTIGNVTVRIWVIGNEYPVAYHVRFDAGNFSDPAIWSEEILGHGSSKTAPGAIRKILDEMMQMFSRTFFQVRGREL